MYSFIHSFTHRLIDLYGSAEDTVHPFDVTVIIYKLMCSYKALLYEAKLNYMIIGCICIENHFYGNKEFFLIVGNNEMHLTTLFRLFWDD